MKSDRRLLQQVRPARLPLALTVGLGLLGGVAIVWQARLVSRLVNQVFLDGRTLDQVSAWLLAFVILSLARAGLAWGSEVAAGRLAIWIKRDLRGRLAAHLLQLGPAYTRTERSGELTNTVTEGIEALDAYFRQYLPQLALAALVPLTILLFVFPLDWVSGLVLLLTAPLIPVFMILIGSLADALTRRQWTSLSRMSAHFLDALQGLTTLKLLGRSREQIRTIARISDQFRQTTMGVLRVAFLSALVLETVATLSTAIVAVQVGLRLLYGQLPFEQAFFVLLLAPEFYLPLRLLGARFHAGMDGVAAAERIFQILEAKPRLEPAPQAPIPLPSRPSLKLDSVHYAYDGGERPALNGLSLELKPGERVALIGPSGAGKSTVAYLLLRFIEPDRGTITVDGQPLHHLPLSAWRRQVAWVPQTPYLFHGTVADNIRLARPAASHDEVVWAARQAHAHTFISALPHGYDTPIGERGARLSGGQAQRVALARAFLKDAPLLVLDEATANLDPQVEALIQESVAHLLRDRTTLLVAHRLTTIYHADRILVVDGGRVVEEGTHAALLEQGGLYRRLVGAHSPALGEDLSRTIRSTQDNPPEPPPAPPGKGPPWTNRSARDGLTESVSHRLLQQAAPFAPWMALAILLGFATVGSSIGLLTTSAYLIARAALHPSIADLQVAIVGVRFFGIARGLFRYLERYVSHHTTFRLLARLRAWFYEALEPLAPARLLQFRSGDLLARIVADVETLENVFLRVIAPPAVALLVALLAGFLLGRFDPRLAGVLLSFLLLAGVGLPLLTRALGGGAGRRLVQVRAELNSTLLDGIQGMADLLAFDQVGRHLERLRSLGGELGSLQGQMAHIGGLHGALAGLLMNLATLGVLAVAIPLVSSADLDGVYLPLLALAVIASFEAVLPLPQAFQYLENSLEAARRLFDIVDAEPAVSEPLAPAPAPSSYSLRVENLRFAYDPGEPPSLDGVSFELPHGGQTAVVGPSGAGKSTLLHLLLRFWDYESGRILLGGRDLRAYRQEDVHRLVAVVSQRTHLFNATVRDNLLLARPDATTAEMIHAARQADIHDFIQSLPQGYDTPVGEQGLRLSGGQRQRLAIARAILKDAPLLLLDEPTASLDAITERQVMGTLQTIMTGRTALVATHRLVGLEAADEILVLRAGRIVERGCHQELLQVGGLYHRMWQLQTQVLADQIGENA
jgi:ATP-binding cassette subfamily C protein CydCD